MYGLVDICLGREVFRVTPNIDGALGLVNPDVIHFHVYRKYQVFEINQPEICRHPQVCDDMLRPTVQLGPTQKVKKTYHGLLRNGSSGNFDCRVRPHTGHINRPCHLVIRNPCDVL